MDLLHSYLKPLKSFKGAMMKLHLTFQLPDNSPKAVLLEQLL